MATIKCTSRMAAPIRRLSGVLARTATKPDAPGACSRTDILSSPQAGIEEDGRDIGEEVRRDVDSRRKQNGRLDQRKIPELQGIDEKTAKTRIGKYLLDHHDAADEISEIKRRHITGGNQRIVSGVYAN